MSETMGPKVAAGAQDSMTSSDLVKDFYLSFRYSQAYTPLQMKLYGELSSFYCTLECDVGALSRQDTTWQKVQRLALPRGHHVVEDFNKRREITNQFIAFSEIVSLRRPGPVLREVLLSSLIDKDISYQKRPRLSMPHNPHASFFRQHVLLGNSTGSVAFNSLFSDLRSEVFDTQGNVLAETFDISWLAELWESNHPGQQFIEPVTASP